MGEKNLDFDKEVNRVGTNCLKYDFAVERGMPSDVLPLWVADMDFETSSYIKEALIKEAEHGIYGYSEMKKPYFDSVANWFESHYNWTIEEEWLIKTPGVVLALCMAVLAYTNENDSVMINLPVYYPFSASVEFNDRHLVSSDLYLGDDNRYHIDFDDFEEKIIENQVKLFFLCNPHNPVGRVWTREELTKIGDICLKHNVIVVSDEIHADFVFNGKHNVFANVKDEYKDITITCTSPSKTFNLAGLQISNIIIANKELREKFQNQLNKVGYSQVGIFGLVACKEAYDKGEEWYQGVKKYIKANVEFAKTYIEENIKNVKMIHHEGTYLIWLDFRETGLTCDQIEDLIINKAKLWLDSGKVFGENGKGFQRINVACTRKTLQEALYRIKKALED